jgi:hypothetical protein
MSQKLTNLSYAILGLCAISLLGFLLRSSSSAFESGQFTRTFEVSVVIGGACLAVAGLCFCMSEQWPVRIGGLSLLLGLGLIADLPPFFWLGMLLIACCLLFLVALIRKLNRA